MLVWNRMPHPFCHQVAIAYKSPNQPLTGKLASYDDANKQLNRKTNMRPSSSQAVRARALLLSKYVHNRLPECPESFHRCRRRRRRRRNCLMFAYYLLSYVTRAASRDKRVRSLAGRGFAAPHHH